MGSFFHRVLPFLFLVVSAAPTTRPAAAANFKCSSSASSKCESLVGYSPINKTTISEIQSLFNVKNRRHILGANGLPLNTSSHYTVQPQHSIKVPIPCLCSNGTGVSNKVPVYTVKKDDGLDFIARTIFSALLKYEQIVEANNITNPNLIEIGQNLTIPLPCSCDDVGNAKVVHYAYVVEDGNTFELIGQKFGADKDTLMKLNDIDDDSKLIAGVAIDVPLKACNSSIGSDSLDHSLGVANGTYAFTANNCVRCQCDAANSWTLQCQPSQLRPSPSSNWSTCPSMLCENSESLSIGNTTSNSCNRTTCSYTGYNNQSILTNLKSVNNCSTPENTSSRIMNQNFLLISTLLLLLHFL